ncbi:MAG: DNA cytosine methyltransferase [Lentisphaerae bacterium]|nr:DNA cytosine methyltransferase [Lentisphaerota bacterium]
MLKGKRAPRLTCVDLFSGAGGLSLGLKLAGFSPVLAVERDRDCCATYRAAFPQTLLWDKPIQECDFTPFSGVDLVAGGPPCQPFSSGGKRLAAHDPRDMIPEFIRAVREIQPKAFLMENVASLFGNPHREYFTAVETELETLGYLIVRKVLNAADYGVPQIRKRGFMIGVRCGKPFCFPKPTNGPGTGIPYVCAKSVLHPETPDGEPNIAKVTYAKNPHLRPSPFDGLMFNGGGRPIDVNQPCRTILASAGGNKTPWIDTLGSVPLYHRYLLNGGAPKSGVLKGARRLTLKECALIQSFPPEFPFQGKKSSRFRQVGNAVPPLLAKVLGLGLRRRLSR